MSLMIETDELLRMRDLYAGRCGTVEVNTAIVEYLADNLIAHRAQLEEHEQQAAAHAHIREQAKAWRAWCAMAHFAPTLVANLYGYHVDHEYGIGLTCPTRESAMIAAADAALGEGWDKESA